METIQAFGGKFVTRAPKGGFDHPVSGKPYRGGQFCPLYAVAGGSGEDAPPRVLPPLAGSPKQIAWAETIRVRAFEQLDANRADAVECWGDDFGQAEATAVLGRIEADLVGRVEARFWIDHRSADLGSGPWIDRQVKDRKALELRAIADRARQEREARQTYTCPGCGTIHRGDGGRMIGFVSAGDALRPGHGTWSCPACRI